MHFTEAVIEEAQRLLALIPLLVHKTLKDVELGGYSIPKNTRVSYLEHTFRLLATLVCGRTSYYQFPVCLLRNFLFLSTYRSPIVLVYKHLNDNISPHSELCALVL